MSKSYVYEQSEVVLTGRSATKQLRSGKVESLYEITPKSSQVGVWKKWVAFDSLYTVSEEVGYGGEHE